MKNFTWAIVGLFVILGGSLWAGGSLTFEERVKAQEAIERVYYQHRIWPKENPGPKPPFEAMVTAEALRGKVETYLRQSQALDQYWRRPITGEQLQAEMNRMASETLDAKALEELFLVLRDDPRLIAECLARPLLADRLSRESYWTDPMIHTEVRAQVDGFRRGVTPDAIARAGGERYRVLWIKKEGGVPFEDARAFVLPPEDFARLVRSLPPAGRISGVMETREAFLIRYTASVTGDEIRGGMVTFPKQSYDAWFRRNVMHDGSVRIAEPAYPYVLPRIHSDGLRSSAPTSPNMWESIWYLPEPRTGHTAVWTGNEMIVWGGMGTDGAHLNSGGRYRPDVSAWTWTPITLEDAPGGRTGHTAVWTGTEMIVWGGQLGNAFLLSGGRYNPVTDTWLPTDESRAPAGRYRHSAVWSGTEMIIWGGQNTTTYLQSGSRYDPARDYWTHICTTEAGCDAPAARNRHTAVWTGNEMIIWGGMGAGDVYVNTGARYSPTRQDQVITPVWVASNADMMSGAPSPRVSHTAVWNGTQMMIWGGMGCSDPPACAAFGPLDTGASYDPTGNWWMTTPAPPGIFIPRQDHSAVWTGTDMIIWGGWNSGVGQRDGARFTPSAWTWTLLSSTDAPDFRWNHTAVWTGTDMIVWGGEDGAGRKFNSGGRYNPVTNAWTTTTPTTLGTVPSPRVDNTTVWTGWETIVWGGNESIGMGASTNTGARYQPAYHTWTPTNTSDPHTPTARYSHRAVWTGTEMMVWGGKDSGPYPNGARYRPDLDFGADPNIWVALPDSGLSGRYNHSAVWTGARMVVWGGQESEAVYFNDGGEYDLGGDAWDAVSPTGVPSARAGHTAVWAEWFDGMTDRQAMIVWGGRDEDEVFGDGGRYIPGAGAGDEGSWEAMQSVGAPVKRYLHSSVWADFWDERMMMQYYEMIVWGGLYCNNIQSGSCMGAQWQADGARYLPIADAWVPICAEPACNPPQSRAGHGAVWTGNQMFVWGGTKLGTSGETQYLDDGRVYDIVQDTWDYVYDYNVPLGRADHASVWMDQGVLVWGGRPVSQSGGVYYPNTPPTSRPYAATELAQYSPAYQTPACISEQSFCDTQNMTQALVNSRDNITDNLMNPVWEPNAPNTLLGACADGQMGQYHMDESVDRIRISTVNGTVFSPDTDVRVDVTVWAGTNFDEDLLALYYCTDAAAASPAWTLLATLTPPGPGAQILTHHFTLQAERSVQAVRAQFGNFGGSAPATACDGADPALHGYDRDDLAFAIGSTFADPGFTLGQTANLYLDGRLSGTGSNPQTVPSHEDAFDSISDPQGYEWYIRDQGTWFGESECLSAYYTDFAGSRLELTEDDFSYLVPWPGPYMVWLRATDELGKRSCRSSWLQIKDGVAPTDVTLWVPNGGESWPYSPSPTDRKEQLLVWNAYDNFDLSRYRLSYSADEGTNWTIIADSLGNSVTNNTPVAIPDNSAGGATSTIQVTGAFTVQDVNVTVNITHPDTAELKVSLIAPDNTEVVLSPNFGAHQSGDPTANFTDTTFDDQAGMFIGSGSPPFTGAFFPMEPLGMLQYKSAAGNWRLKVVDNAAGNTGTITSWSLQIASNYASSYWWSLPTQAEAAAAVPPQAFPSARCRIRVQVWDGAGNSHAVNSTDDSDANFYIIQPTTTSVKTLILWNSERIKAMFGQQAVTDLAEKLDALADHLKVTGKVLDLDQVPAVRTAYTAWDAAPQNQTLANAVAQAVRTYLYDPSTGQIPKTYTNTQNLILVGDDFQIPFHRIPDGTMLGSYTESVYPSEVGINTKTTVGSAVAQGYILTDNYYSEFSPETSGLDSPHDKIYQNDLAVGRLVEEPDQIMGLVDTFLAYDGQLNVPAGAGQVHASGFTFVYDSALSIKEAYRAKRGIGNVDCLLDDPGRALDPPTLNCDAAPTASDSEKPYTPEDLGDQVFGAGAHAISTVMTHANHFAFSASEEQTPSAGDANLCTETTYSAACGHIIPDTDDLTAAVVLTSGCHSALPIPKDGCPADTPAAIPDDGISTLESTITVAGSGIAAVSDINVRLNIQHPNDEDLEVILVGPNLIEVTLISWVGGTGDHFTHTTLDDEAGINIIDMGETAPYTGFYIPVGPLSTLDGQPPDGDWTLRILDHTAGNAGTLVCWSITFNEQVHYPSPYNHDLAEDMARKNVLGYIGNTGYGWAIQHGKGLTEMLMMMLNDEFIDNTSITVGRALAEAKRDYFTEDKRYDVFDEKVLHELTLFGVPNYLIVTSTAGMRDGDLGPGTSDQGPGTKDQGQVAEEALPPPDGPDYGCANGVCLEKETRTSALFADLPSGMTELLMNFRFADFGTYQLIEVCEELDGLPGCSRTGDDYFGEYYTLNGYASGETGDAIQPKFIYESYLSGTTPHGVLFTGGSLNDPEPNFKPLGAVPRSTNMDPNPDSGPLPASGGFVPGLKSSSTPTGTATLRASEEKEYVNMVVHTGYCTDYNSGTKECIENRYKDMQFAVYYHLTSGDTTAPTLAAETESTYSASGLPQAIPDDNSTGLSSAKAVSGSGISSITDINVTLNISHTRTSELRLSLIAPNAIEVLLSNARGGNGNDYGGAVTPVRHTVFDMDATQGIAVGVASFRGTFKPEGDLTVLNGLAADGTWTLKVVDNASGETGTLNSWSITFNERYHSLSGLNATFKVKASDASGIYRVLVTYKDAGLVSPQWKSLDLVENTVAGYWEGQVGLYGTTTYLIQAVDKAGNIAQVKESGQDHGSGTEGVKYGSTWEYAKTFSIPIADFDGDKLPDVYEQQNSACLNWQSGDAGLDPDKDYLTSLQEFFGATKPCLGDTDSGGDNDGSEKNNGRNPLQAGDDKPLMLKAAKGSGNITLLEWPDGVQGTVECPVKPTVGDNAFIDGYYFVYRSLGDPFFTTGELLTAGGLTEMTRCHPDDIAIAPGQIYYYKIFNYALVPPQVGVVLPGTGSSSGGTPVSVLGLDFKTGARIFFDGIPATGVTWVNSSQLNCTTPTHTAGTVTVRVVNPDGAEGTLPNGFQYQ